VHAQSLIFAALLAACSRAAPEPAPRHFGAESDAGPVRCLDHSPYLTKWTPVTPRNQDGSDVPCTWVLVHSGKGPIVWADPSIVEMPK
jgi:hypothetical protein